MQGIQLAVQREDRATVDGWSPATRTAGPVLMGDIRYTAIDCGGSLHRRAPSVRDLGAPRTSFALGVRERHGALGGSDRVSRARAWDQERGRGGARVGLASVVCLADGYGVEVCVPRRITVVRVSCLGAMSAVTGHVVRNESCKHARGRDCAGEEFMLPCPRNGHVPSTHLERIRGVHLGWGGAGTSGDGGSCFDVIFVI